MRTLEVVGSLLLALALMAIIVLVVTTPIPPPETHDCIYMCRHLEFPAMEPRCHACPGYTLP